MSSHQRYLEAPYRAQDEIILAREHWDENLAEDVYDRLVNEGEVTSSLDDWINSRDSEAYFEDWYDSLGE